MGIEKSLVPFAPSICLFFSFAIQPRAVFSVSAPELTFVRVFFVGV